MLPFTFLLLLQTALVSAQSTTLSLDSSTSISASSVPNPPTFRLPASRSLHVSIAFCNSSQTTPRFFVTNNTQISNPGPNGGTGVFEIALNNGYGVQKINTTLTGILAMSGSTDVDFEIGVTDGEPMHEVLSALPLLGDTTANQALLFSAPFSPPPNTDPSYPNYTLPSANLTFPDASTNSSNFTLLLAPTADDLAHSIPQTGCAITRAAQNSHTGSQVFNSLWLRDEQGWRMEWLIAGLNPLTNYTAYVVQNQTKVSGPIYLATKSAIFSCPLVHSLPYCPAVSYAVPLPPPPRGFDAHDSRTVPDSLTGPLLGYLTNFTTMLTTFACGRDLYSPLQTCADCQREYRNWLCAVSLVRCSEQSPESGGSSSTSTSTTALQQQTDAQFPVSALLPVPTTSPALQRNSPGLQPNTNYTMLLPCMETCNAADRACPYFLGFKCPTPRFNANASYGVGFIDSGEEGVMGGGTTGYSQDRWGNVWCHGPGLEQNYAT